MAQRFLIRLERFVDRSAGDIAVCALLFAPLLVVVGLWTDIRAKDRDFAHAPVSASAPETLILRSSI